MSINGDRSAAGFLYDRSDRAEHYIDIHPPLHVHNDVFEIYFLTNGTCTYFVDNKSYDLVQGDIIIIPDGVIHNTVYENDCHVRRLIHCAGSFIPSEVISLLPGIGHLYRNPALFDRFVQLFDSIENEFLHGDPFSDAVLHAYVSLLFFQIARNRNLFDRSAAGNRYITKVISFVQSHYSEEISLQDVAEVCAVSPEHVSRLFKKVTGFGFCEYLGILRMQKAEQLLKSDHARSVTEIAALCGYDDSNYFSVKFKKLHGMPPKQFQLQYKKKGREASSDG